MRGKLARILPVSLYLLLAVCVAQLKCCIWIFLLPKYIMKRLFLRKRFKHTIQIVLHVNFAPRRLIML